MQEITIVCDWCHGESQRSVADGETTLALDGRAMTADLCTDHRKRLEESLAVFMSIARRTDRAPATSRRGPKVSPEPNADGMIQCDLCERQFEKPQGLGRHKLVAHGITGQSRQPVTA